MSGWYRTGTVAVVNGNANIVGTSTLWVSQATVGDIFYGPDLVAYEITSVTDDTHAAIKQIGGTAAYAGSTLSAQAYVIIRNFTSTTNAALALNLADMINKWHVSLDELLNWLTVTGTVSLTNPATGIAASVKTPSQIQAEWIGSVSKAVTTADVILTTTEAGNAFITATGALTGNRSIILPAAQGHLIAFTNNTTGAFTLTVKTAAGTGGVVAQGSRALLYSDGANVVTVLSSGGGGGMVYPPAGIAVSTGTAWSTAPATTGSGSVVKSQYPVLVSPTMDSLQTGGLDFTSIAGADAVMHIHSDGATALTGIMLHNGSSGNRWDILSNSGVLGVYLASYGLTAMTFDDVTADANIPHNLNTSGQLTTHGFAPNLYTNSAATLTLSNILHTIVQTTTAATYTFPSAATYPYLEFHLVTQFAGAVISASANVVPLAGGSPVTAILPATAGKWATLQSNGANWVIVAAN